MKNQTIVKCLSLLVLMGALAHLATAQALPPTLLQIDVKNWVNYNHDTADITKFATTVSADMAVGTWTITGIRFHQNALDHISGVYFPVSVQLSVAP